MRIIAFQNWYNMHFRRHENLKFHKTEVRKRSVKRLLERYERIHSFSNLSDDRSKASSKMMPPHSEI